MSGEATVLLLSDNIIQIPVLITTTFARSTGETRIALNPWCQADFPRSERSTLSMSALRKREALSGTLV